MGSSKDFFDIPTTVWNISMMSIYVVLSTSTNLLTHSSTCFSIISTMLIYVLYSSSMHFYIAIIRDLDTYLRCWSTYFIVLLCTFTLYLYVILVHIYDVYLRISMVLLRAFSFLFYVILVHIYDVNLRTFVVLLRALQLFLLRDFGTYLRITTYVKICSSTYFWKST